MDCSRYPARVMVKRAQATGPGRWRIGLRVLLYLALAVLPASCGTGYYLQAINGQAELMRSRQPLEKVLLQADTPEELRQKLLVVDAALVFARVYLGLPRSRSYGHYADLGRPYVVWNVFAAPDLSLEPREWCYPVAGCTTYRGWFREERARAFAAALESQGDDVHVGGVPAYSTLGWFADPVLNTMLRYTDTAVAGLLFHELAHQLLYVPGDTLFNEGFASLVEQEGTRRWLASRGDEAARCAFDTGLVRRAAARQLVAGLRAELAVIYAAPGPKDQRRAARDAAFERSREHYRALRADWTGPPVFDSWFDEGLNNARLVALSSYETHVPAFARLLADAGGDFPRFYARVRELAELDPAERMRFLASLAPLSGGPASGNCP